MVREVNREASDRLLDAVLYGGDRRWLEELLAGCDPSRLGTRGVSPLHGAATLEDVTALRLCLEAATLVDTRSTPDLLTPLMLSAAWGRPQATALLLAAGADPYLADLEALTAWDYAASAPPCLRLLQLADDHRTDRSSLYRSLEAHSSTSASTHYHSLDRAFLLTSLFTEDESTEYSDSRISEDVVDVFETGMIASDSGDRFETASENDDSDRFERREENIEDSKPDRDVDRLEERMRALLRTDERISEDAAFENPPETDERREGDCKPKWRPKKKQILGEDDVFADPRSLTTKKGSRRNIDRKSDREPRRREKDIGGRGADSDWSVSECCLSGRSSVCSIAPSRSDTEELRDGVVRLMGECGPLTQTTKTVYRHYLERRSGAGAGPGPVVRGGTSAELEAVCREDGDRLLAKWAPLEAAMVESVRGRMVAGVARMARPPNLFFNYLLLEPTRAATLAEFVDALFYVGKGKAERPYDHLQEALKKEGRGAKVERIRAIWAAGGRVVCLRPFREIGSDEALTREAAMIDALTLPRLTNTKRGEYHGLASTWCRRDKCRLGALLLATSWRTYTQQATQQQATQQQQRHFTHSRPQSKFTFYT